MSRRAVPYPCAWLAVPDRAWRPDGEALTSAEATVLAVLVDRWRRAESDVVVLSTEEFAGAAGLSVRGVETARASLLARALIVRVHAGGGRGRASTYRLGRWAQKGAPEDPETPQGNPAMSAKTPNGNPATPAWLEEKPARNPAPNPAREPTNGAGNGTAAPSSEDQRSEADPDPSGLRPSGRAGAAPDSEVLPEMLLDAEMILELWFREYGRRFEAAFPREGRWHAGVVGPRQRELLLEMVGTRAYTAQEHESLCERVLDVFFANEGERASRFGWWRLVRELPRWLSESSRASGSTSSKRREQLERGIERTRALVPANGGGE